VKVALSEKSKVCFKQNQNVLLFAFQIGQHDILDMRVSFVGVPLPFPELAVALNIAVLYSLDQRALLDRSLSVFFDIAGLSPASFDTHFPTA